MIGYVISFGAIMWHSQQQHQQSTNHQRYPTTTTTTMFDISIMTNFLSTISLQSQQRVLSFYNTLTSSRSSNNNSSHSPSSSSGRLVPKKMDIHQCFMKLERQMFESTIPLWDVLDTTTIYMHRNGQAESCGNSSSSLSLSRSTVADASNKNVGPEVNINLTDPSSTLSSSSSTSNIKQIFLTALQELYDLGQACPDFSKYHVESLLTRVFANMMSLSQCHSDDENSNQRKTRQLGLYDFCDMGEDRTPVLLDHKKLLPNTIIQQEGTRTSTYTLLPCHFHTEHGLQVTSLLQLTRLLLSSSSSSNSTDSNTVQSSNESNDTNCMITPNGEETCTDNSDVPTTNTHGSIATHGLHLYAVPAGRVFMHVAAYIGQIIPLDHVPGADPKQPVYLKVLSTSPAVFDLYNFFTREESSELVQRALSETKESHRIKRSTTGTGEHHVNTRRTSESGFDTDGATSIKIKK
jgi:hypothetical protein